MIAGRPTDFRGREWVDPQPLQAPATGSHDVAFRYGAGREIVQRDHVVLVRGAEKMEQFMSVESRSGPHGSVQSPAEHGILRVANRELDAAMQADVSGH